MEFGQSQPYGLSQLNFSNSLPGYPRPYTTTSSQESNSSTSSTSSSFDASSQKSISSASSLESDSSYPTCAKARPQVCLPPLGSVANQTVASQHNGHPRRSTGTIQKPPTLVRQDERKVTFVDSLVGTLFCCVFDFLYSSLSHHPLADSATQMVEVIWPLSAAPPPCRPNASGVLSLRRYIEETLRRSRTSYSTLQVALYYLILIMPCVPKTDFTKEQLVDSPSFRALQCGRRMFLAALILASKYLQDRNYSAKAWSKMSGLKVVEINLNERAFLSAVNWKLHIPDSIFKRWTDIVLRYTPSQFPPPPDQCLQATDMKSCWKSVIPLLTPDLDTIHVPQTQLRPAAQPVSFITSYAELPSFLEPELAVTPPVPAVTSIIPSLPTPRPTPPPGFNTPAVSVASLDLWVSATRPSNSRRPSLASSRTSSGSSPESMVSDSSRLSRASSISSVSTLSTVASSQSCLARSVTRRNAAGALPSKIMEDSELVRIMEDDLVSSPMSTDDMSISGDAASLAPLRRSRPGFGFTASKRGLRPELVLESSEGESELQKLVRASIWASEESNNGLAQMVLEDDIPARLGCNLDDVRISLTPSPAASECRKRTRDGTDDVQKRRRLSRGRQSVAVY